MRLKPLIKAPKPPINLWKIQELKKNLEKLLEKSHCSKKIYKKCLGPKRHAERISKTKKKIRKNSKEILRLKEKKKKFLEPEKNS